MSTENITLPKLNKLSNVNPILIYDGIMEMIFQDDMSKSSEKKQERKSPISGGRISKIVKGFFRKH